LGQFFGSIIGLLLGAILLLNFFAPLIAGVWLAVLGEWRLIWLGVGYMMIGALVLSLLLLPGMIFGMGAIAAGTIRNRFLLILAGIPAMAWTYVVAIGSCAVMLATVSDYIDWGDDSIPYLAWGASVSVAPWAFMAAKDAQSGGDSWAGMTAGFLNIACISSCFLYYFEPFEGLDEWAIRIGAVMLVSFAIQALAFLFQALFGSMEQA
jgi:hypothetical protein